MFLLPGVTDPLHPQPIVAIPDRFVCPYTRGCVVDEDLQPTDSICYFTKVVIRFHPIWCLIVPPYMVASYTTL